MFILLRLTNHNGRNAPAIVTVQLLSRGLSFAQKFLDLWKDNYAKGVKVSSVNTSPKSTRTSNNTNKNSAPSNQSTSRAAPDNLAICGLCLHPGVTPVVNDCPNGHCIWYHKSNEPCFCQRKEYLQKAQKTQKNHPNFIICDGTLAPDQCHANRQVTEQERGTIARAAAFGMIDLPSQTAAAVAPATSDLNLKTKQFLYDCVTGAITTRPN